MQTYWSAIGSRVLFAAVLIGAGLTGAIAAHSIGLVVSIIAAIICTLVAFAAAYWARSADRRSRRDAMASHGTWIGDVFSRQHGRVVEYATVLTPDALEFWETNSQEHPSLRLSKADIRDIEPSPLDLFASAGDFSLSHGRGDELKLTLRGPCWGEYPTPPRMLRQFISRIDDWRSNN